MRTRRYAMPRHRTRSAVHSTDSGSHYTNGKLIMPGYVPTVWANVEPGHTVLARDGRPRLIFDVRPAEPGTLMVTTNEGRWPVELSRPAIIVESSMQEAVVSILVTFPGSEILS